MKRANEFEEVEVDDVPVSALVQVRRGNSPGSVPGLEDEEPADPEELERQVMAEEWGPVLALPVKAKRSGFPPAMGNTDVDFNAFASVDFDRLRPEFDKALYKADRLKEQLGDLFIMLSIVKERLPTEAKRLVLRYLEQGLIELEDIASEDMQIFVRLYLRARRLQREIAELREVSRSRRERQARAWLES